MRVTLQRVDDAFHFRGFNEDGLSANFDTTPEEGGNNQGPGPMQTTAMALGSCSAIDVVLILQKGRQQIDSFDIEVDYERATDQTPAVFTQFHVHYLLTGKLDVARVRRAVDLSVRKYCSIATMLAKTAEITYSFSVNGTRYEEEV